MSKIIDQLNKVKIYNSHSYAGHGNVYISYTAAQHGRASRAAHWQVIRPGFKTDPDAHWLNYGCKTFLVSGHYTLSHKEKKAATLEQAKAWASERYNIKEWAKTPFGDWMDANFVKLRNQHIKLQLKEVQNET